MCANMCVEGKGHVAGVSPHLLPYLSQELNSCRQTEQQVSSPEPCSVWKLYQYSCSLKHTSYEKPYKESHQQKMDWTHGLITGNSKNDPEYGGKQIHCPCSFVYVYV